MAKWTREKIIREILRREAAGLPLALGNRPESVDDRLYAAGSRIFGSWGNAVQAAGIAPGRARVHENWQPAKVLSKIRALARRPQPIQPGEMKRRYTQLMQAARRCFGTWAKAVVAAGVDPNRLKGIVPWTKPRIVEAILLRALNGEPLGSQSVKPGSLSKAAAREFGSWPAALRAAGLNPQELAPRARDGDIQSVAVVGEAEKPAALIWPSQRANDRAPGLSGSTGSRQYRRWRTDEVLSAIRSRTAEKKRMNAAAVADEDGSLYRVAARRYGSWNAALQAAGLDPHECRARKTPFGHTSSDGETQDMRPGDST